MPDTKTAIKDIDYTGQRFGYLTVLHRDPDRPAKHWICRCDCGNETSANIYNLRSGNTIRCTDRHCKTHVPDLVGQRFGKLTVVSFAGFLEFGNQGRIGSHWECACDCGNSVKVRTKSLLTGHTKSCGCLQVDVQRQRKTTHGGARSRLYKEYLNMKSRCMTASATGYQHYGGRGIVVCDEWLQSFENFRDWSLNNGYRDDLTLDRIDVNGNYEPKNCRWITIQQQLENTRRNVFVMVEDEKMIITKALKKLGLSYGKFRWRRQKFPEMPNEEIIQLLMEEQNGRKFD